MTKIIACLAIGCMLCLPVSGQDKAGVAIETKDVNISLSPDSMVEVRMNFVIPPHVKIGSNRMVILTPVVQGGTATQVLPSVYVFGRKRSIISERKKRLPVDAYEIVHRKNGTEQTVNYQATLPYQSWMKEVSLYMDRDLCGCNDRPVSNSEQSLAQATLALPEPARPASPAIAFIAPEPETYKRRTRAGNAFVDFPVNETVIYPDYRKNPAELAKIHQTVEDVPHAEILHIQIHGYASPEGSYANNVRLAEGRMEALKRYIIRKYQLSDTIFGTRSTPEDWEGFKVRLMASDMEEKETILAIINSEMQPDEKEARLKKLGKPYAYILKEWFPALRHSDYEIEYHVESFTAEQAREIIRTRPELLSLREMFDAAQLCGKGTDEYNRIFETAVRFFPNDPAAHLNAAAMELERGNKVAAGEYMKKADLNMREAQIILQLINPE